MRIATKRGHVVVVKIHKHKRRGEDWQCCWFSFLQPMRKPLQNVVVLNRHFLAFVGSSALGMIIALGYKCAAQMDVATCARIPSIVKEWGSDTSEDADTVRNDVVLTISTSWRHLFRFHDVTCEREIVLNQRG
ncbi:uncharacterized protein LOC106151026 [Lingula anatina]|uniref:Uncharacterized protein LOC106151026 n=1 Tax=Lingula anatina TaxID=7574 RepID=A0A1S3H234_LINAN|nr:uncharacterized protein LOC106151026 [Lingula anatina]|eukprot:XP_013379541.1 uncharacterized protein LOC106151026 [Lingula anatina]